MMLGGVSQFQEEMFAEFTDTAKKIYLKPLTIKICNEKQKKNGLF